MKREKSCPQKVFWRWKGGRRMVCNARMGHKCSGLILVDLLVYENTM